MRECCLHGRELLDHRMEGEREKVNTERLKQGCVMEPSTRCLARGVTHRVAHYLLCPHVQRDMLDPLLRTLATV